MIQLRFITALNTWELYKPGIGVIATMLGTFDTPQGAYEFQIGDCFQESIFII